MALASSAGCASASQQRSVCSSFISDVDIWRCAALRIKCYGDTADIAVSERADALLGMGTARGSASGCKSRMRLRRCRTCIARKPSIDTGSTIRAHSDAWDGREAAE